MKKIALVILLAAGFGFCANAQKFAHINSQELVSLMSEMDSARVRLNTYQADLEETFQGMQDEYQTKYTDYQRKVETWAPTVRETKESELQELVNRIQQFQQSAPQDLQQMQQTLLAPVYEKADAAIQRVAKSMGFIYVFDTSNGTITYVDETQSTNLLELLKAELGIPAEKVSPTVIE